MRSLLSSPPYWHAYSRAIYCERGFPNLRFDGDFLQATKCAFLKPQKKSRGRQLSSEIRSSVATFRVTIEQPTKAHRPTAFFAQVSWPNIGPAAARPAGPAPTALVCIYSL